MADCLYVVLLIDKALCQQLLACPPVQIHNMLRIKLTTLQLVGNPLYHLNHIHLSVAVKLIYIYNNM